MVQPVARSRHDPHQRAKPLRVLRHKFGWQVPVAHQMAGAVEVGHDPLQKLGPLRQARADRVPFRIRDQDRHMAERPFALLRWSPGVEPEIDARVPQVLLAPGKAGGDVFWRKPRQLRDEWCPDRAHGAACVKKLIRHAGLRRVTGEDRRRDGAGYGAVHRTVISMPRASGRVSAEIPRSELRSPVHRHRGHGHALQTGQDAAPRPRCR